LVGGRVKRMVKGYVGDVTMGDVRRLFDRDAREVYAVLTRDQDTLPEGGRLKRFYHRTRLLFRGMSSKLSPVRRLLFVVSLVAAVLGFVQIRADIASQGVEVSTSPLWFMVSILGLTFLLALELVDRIRVRDELEVARALQLELLPRTTPAIPGYEIAHSYRTANEVGGDYYDFLPLADGRFAVVIGDASGHGMASGLLMAIANATLKIALDFDPAPVNVIALLNRVMCRTGNRRSFMTMFYGVLSPDSGRLEYVCAGHPFPLLRRADGSTVELGRGGLPLGIRNELEIAAETVAVAPGDSLALYTDGLPEATNRLGEAFGYDRVRTLVAAGGPPQTVHDRVNGTFRAFLGDEPLRDDACLVVLARR
jgi:phosphoserine phosphatase RsbU/P